MAFFWLILNGLCKVTRIKGKGDHVSHVVKPAVLSRCYLWSLWRIGSRNQICILERLLYQKLPKKLPARRGPRNICVPETSLSHQSVLPLTPLLQKVNLGMLSLIEGISDPPSVMQGLFHLTATAIRFPHLETLPPAFTSSSFSPLPCLLGPILTSGLSSITPVQLPATIHSC